MLHLGPMQRFPFMCSQKASHVHASSWSGFCPRQVSEIAISSVRSHWFNSELAGRASVFGAEGGRRIRTFVGISRRPCQKVRSLLGSGLVAGEGFEPS
jgi:hypothetical protein